jgi:hypothetical protein
MSQYVLGNPHWEHGAVTFLCGGDQGIPSFGTDLSCAVRFETVDQALFYRGNMLKRLGGRAKQYHVHELLLGGGLQDLGY